MSLSLETLKEHLSYDPETGVFIRLTKAPGRQRKQAGGMNRGYRDIKVCGKRYKAHRLAWFYYYGEWPKHTIDHINNNKDDNRIANLRDVTVYENQQNRADSKRNGGVRTTQAQSLYNRTVRRARRQTKTGQGTQRQIKADKGV